MPQAALSLDVSVALVLTGQIRFESCFKLLAFGANVTDLRAVRDGYILKTSQFFRLTVAVGKKADGHWIGNDYAPFTLLQRVRRDPMSD